MTTALLWRRAPVLLLAFTAMAATSAMSSPLPVRIQQAEVSPLTIERARATRTERGIRLSGDVVRRFGIRGSSPERIRLDVYLTGQAQPMCAYANRQGFTRVGTPRARFSGFVPVDPAAAIAHVDVAVERALSKRCVV